jgi:1,4-alpha-glucan branching enzyme
MYHEVLNSDSERYWGSNVGNFGAVRAEPLSGDGNHHLITLNIPPLGTVILKPEGLKKKRKPKGIKP